MYRPQFLYLGMYFLPLVKWFTFNFKLQLIFTKCKQSLLIHIPSYHSSQVTHFCFVPSSFGIFFYPTFENWLLLMMPLPGWSHVTHKLMPTHRSPSTRAANSGGRHSGGTGRTCNSTTRHWFQSSRVYPISLPRRTSLFFKLERHPTFLKQNAKISFPWDEKRSLRYNVNFYLKAKVAT